MTIDHDHTATTDPSDRRAARRRRAARVGVALGLSVVVAFTGACRRKSGAAIDPQVKAWHDKYVAAVQDMSDAAQKGVDLKAGCKAAVEALKSHEAQITQTPDSKLTELVKEFVTEREEAYNKCAESGQTPAASPTIPKIQNRVNELNTAYTEKK